MPPMTRSRQAQAANSGEMHADALLPPPLEIPVSSQPSPPRPRLINTKRKRLTQPRNDGFSAFSDDTLYKALEVPEYSRKYQNILPKGYQLNYSETNARPCKKMPTLQFRTDIPGSTVASVSFVDLPGQELNTGGSAGPHGSRHKINSQRPGSAVVIFADEPVRHSGISQGSRVQKHSLRLVRGMSSQTWTVVPLPDSMPAPLKEIPIPPLPTSYVRKAPSRKPPAHSKKTAQKESGKASPKKKKRRAGETTMTRSSSSESFHSEALCTDEPSLSASSHEDSRAGLGLDAPPSTSNGNDPSLPGRTLQAVSRVPTYSSVQKEATSGLYHNDASLAERMSSLKEWITSESTKMCQSGRLRQGLKAATSEILGLATTHSISIDTVESVRDIVRNKMAESTDIAELKRRLCVEIIRSRHRDYNVYSDPVKPQLVL